MYLPIITLKLDGKARITYEVGWMTMNDTLPRRYSIPFKPECYERRCYENNPRDEYGCKIEMPISCESKINSQAWIIAYSWMNFSQSNSSYEILGTHKMKFVLFKWKKKSFSFMPFQLIGTKIEFQMLFIYNLNTNVLIQ